MSHSQATPAIATQAAVRRLPRWALFLLCLAYVIPGYVARAPWKNADVAAFGVMSELAKGHVSWLAPTVLGQPVDNPALLPYWLGAWAMQWLPGHPEFAARMPFMLALSTALYLTWHATYRFALLPSARPVTFAFGGEAHPVDYARSLADAGLLALLACLGLAQLSHETTPAVIQFMAVAALLRAMASFAFPDRFRPGMAALWVLGLLTLAWSGSPLLALAIGFLPALLHAGSFLSPGKFRQPRHNLAPAWVLTWIMGCLVTVLSASELGPDAVQRLEQASFAIKAIGSMGRLLFWFAWPVWPLVLWTLWRWRRHLAAPHLQSPLWLACVLIGASTWAPVPDRSLMSALPALAILSAFALPTLKRSFASLVDWFSVLFFSLCALTIWVMWLAMLTGFPSKPAANVMRLAPGFVLDFSWLAFTAGAMATLIWLKLVKWRWGEHSTLLWKSLVLAATGSTLCWLLLTTLWMPLLDYARSYESIFRRIASLMPSERACTVVHGLTQAQAAGLAHHAKLNLKMAPTKEICASMVVAQQAVDSLPNKVNLTEWAFKAKLNRATDKKEVFLLYQWVGAPATAESNTGPAQR